MSGQPGRTSPQNFVTSKILGSGSQPQFFLLNIFGIGMAPATSQVDTKNKNFGDIRDIPQGAALNFCESFLELW
jgi:hypothetical protein